ncbi:hypothetical protein JGU66_34545 [Myxococcaceae bacterium JPH2]|nr:hypothetical protein [Myxococcaceae bacterium JPH2]
MRMRLSFLTSLMALALLGGLQASAADGDSIPEGCVDKRYCDGTQCYAAEDSISMLACGCGLLDPTCGVGRCVEGAYCDGSACGDAGMCHPIDSPISQVMCAGAKMDATCTLPASTCGAGSCVDGAYCDGCGCQPLDSAPSQALCACKLADPRAGVGSCVDGGYCDDLASEAGHCFKPEADVSRAMCRGAVLDKCVASPPAEPVSCKDGVYCDASRCYADDSALSKQNCAFVDGSASGKQGLVKALGPYDVGVIPKRPWGCPAGSEYVQFYMDDEDNHNNNYLWGWVGATRQNNQGTTLGFCRVDGAKFHPLYHSWNTDLRKETYAVLKLGGTCPPGSMEFVRNFDNEDHNNQNSHVGNIWPNVSNNNTSLRFCMFMPSNNGAMGGFPSLGMEYGVFAASNYSSAYWLAQGYIHTDDEDHNNANSYSYNNNGNPALLIHAMVFGSTNTEMRLAKVGNAPAPCTKLVHYYTGANLSAWYDGANCYIKPVPPSGTPFVWSNNYYVSAGPNHSCSEGVYDGANCYIMSAPAGTTAFKWGNAFYYAE